jgi:ankyrin repeat protein
LDIGATPLHIASQVFPNHFDNKEEGWKERIRVMEYLIGRGAHVNDRDNEGDTPLHYAIESNYVQPVEILLDLGAAPDLGNYEGDTPLHMAVVAKDRCKEEMVQALLKRNANVNVRENSAAATPLHTAARYCVGTSIIKVLIEHGADLESRNLHNWTPLACIALWGADRYKQKYLLQSIKLLVKAGSDPRAKVGIDPCEPLVDKVLRNETGRVKKWVINYFKQYA